MVDFFEFLMKLFKLFKTASTVDLERLEGKIAHSDT